MKPRTRSVVISLVAVCGGLSCASPPTGGPAAPVGAGTRTDDVLLIPPLPMPHTARLPEQGGEPGLDFRLGPSPVTAAPALSSSGPPTPLTPAGTGRLLARLPALPADRAEPFRFPTASPPAPRAGAVVVAAFPADTARSRPRPEPAEAGPLRVLRIVPSGGTELVPHVTVTFSEPMVPLTGTGAADAMRPPVELTPQPAGRWTWIDTRTARFVPDGRLPMATHFTVVVPAGTRSLSGGVLSEAVRTEFETPAARAIGGYPALDPDVLARRGPRGRPPWLRQEAAGSARLDPVMLVVFDQRIDGAALLAATRLLADGRLHPVRLASAAELAADTVASALAAVAREGYWAAFVPAGPLPRDADIRLVFEAGTRSAEGSRSTAAAQEMRFRTYGPLRLIGSDCWGGSDCLPGQPWSLRFSNPIDTAAWSDRLIRVEPALRDMSIQVHGGEVRITGSGRPNTRHTVLLDPAIRDVFGQRLGERRTATFAVGAAHPVVMLPGSPMIVLDPAGPPAVMVRSLGVRVLHVRVARVRSRDWPAYQHAVARWSSGETPAMSPPGEIVVSMSVPVRAETGTQRRPWTWAPR